MPWLRAGAPEGKGWEVHRLRSGAGLRQQEKAEKDLREMRGVVFSVVSNNQPKSK